MTRSARDCFVAKITAGRVAAAPGRQILDMLDQFEAGYQATLGDAAAARRAALETLDVQRGLAAKRVRELHGSIIAQANVLAAAQTYRDKIGALRDSKGFMGWGNRAPIRYGKSWQPSLGAALNSLLARDINELATWNNVDKLAEKMRGEAHRTFSDAIGAMAPKLGIVRRETLELDFLREVMGQDSGNPLAKGWAEAWKKTQERMADDFIGAGGNLTKREDWNISNPQLDAAKVRAGGAERFKAFVRDRVKRESMPDYATGKPLTDARFEELLNDVTNSIIGTYDGLPSSRFTGKRMLANERDFSRFFVWKDAEAWLDIAKAYGTNDSPFQTAMQHIDSMTRDTAMMRVWGPNPEATKRFALKLFDREVGELHVAAESDDPRARAKATSQNNRLESRIRSDRKRFEDLWAEITRANRVPINYGLAEKLGTTRDLLSATQLGSAMISSLNDPGTVAMAARFNGLPIVNIFQRAARMMVETGSEIFAAQQGLVLDSLAHMAHQNDRAMGEMIRTGWAGKLATANIRLQGLRRWTVMLRASFGLEVMAHTARNLEVNFAQLAPRFREALERYGIGESDWKLIQGVEPHMPRPNAPMLRAADIEDGGTLAHRTVAEKFSRMITTEMDHALVDTDPVTRAWLVGDTRPGAFTGEMRRAIAQYRMFPASFMLVHSARWFSRGWDGKRLSHAALTFMAMTVLGAGSMQMKEMLAGRDPLTLDPKDSKGVRAWGRAILQGGGLGVFGDMLFIDQTRYGNTWAATLAGPMFGFPEAVLGDFFMGNIQKAIKGQQTHWLGDAAYIGGRYIPGSTFWPTRLAFQRGVLDQLAIALDPSGAFQRQHRLEQTARKEFGQSYWWQPGRIRPARAPELMSMFGGRP